MPKYTGKGSISLSHTEELVRFTFDYSGEDRANPSGFGLIAGSACVLSAEQFMKKEKTFRLTRVIGHDDVDTVLNASPTTECVVRRMSSEGRSNEQRLKNPRDIQVVRAMQALISMCKTQAQMDIIQFACNALLGQDYALEKRYTFRSEFPANR